MLKKELEQRARVLEALLKYVAYHWLVDVEAVSTAAHEARKNVRGAKARRILQNLESRFPKDSAGYLGRLWDEGVSLPLDEELLQILGEGLVVDIEQGKNGLIFIIKRTDVPLTDDDGTRNN